MSPVGNLPAFIAREAFGGKRYWRRCGAKREVALIIHDAQALDVAGPLDVFAEANASLSSDEAYDCLLPTLLADDQDEVGSGTAALCDLA